MKLYILEVEDSYDEPFFRFVGAFSTPEKRQAFMKAYAERTVTRFDGSTYPRLRDWNIEDVELDGAGPSDLE